MKSSWDASSWPAVTSTESPRKSGTTFTILTSSSAVTLSVNHWTLQPTRSSLNAHEATASSALMIPLFAIPPGSSTLALGRSPSSPSSFAPTAPVPISSAATASALISGFG